MNRNRISWMLVFGVIMAFWCSMGRAAAPWERLLAFNRVEADPDAEYKMGEDNGPWMIMASSFSGDGAKDQARQLVYELRKRYKLPAYVHCARFDFGETKGRGIDRFGDSPKMRYRCGDELEEIAVLVGNYPAVDDPGAQKTLRKLKYARPRCLEVKQGQATHQSLAGWRWNQKTFQEYIGSDKKEKGPMGHAFITTNPLLPKDYYASKGLDPAVLKMNKRVKHSLLDCPGKYTVQVATFKGNVVIKPDQIQAIENGKRIKSKLADAAMKAHELTEALRVKGWEAYEFHDHHASIVTVGSFGSVGTPRVDGRIEINPKVHAIMRTFGAKSVNVSGKGSGLASPKSLVRIPFDIQPIPVEVPKRSISREIAGWGLGLGR